MRSFRPGAEVRSTKTFRPFYHGQKMTVPADAEFIIQGFHRPGQDLWFGLPQLGAPHPRGSDYQNLRLRLVHRQSGGQLLVTPSEFDRYFEVERGSEPEEEYMNMPGVFDQTTQSLRPPVDRPPSSPGDSTAVGRRPHLQKEEARA